MWSLVLKRNCTMHLLKMTRTTFFKTIAREIKTCNKKERLNSTLKSAKKQGQPGIHSQQAKQE